MVSSLSLHTTLPVIRELSIFIAWDYLALALCLKYWSVESENNKTNIRLETLNVSIHTWRVPSFNSRVQLGDGVCDRVDISKDSMNYNIEDHEG